MTMPHIIYSEDGSILIEWVLPNHKRFGITIERDPSESGWYFVSRDGDCEFGELPPEMVGCLSGLHLTMTVVPPNSPAHTSS
jgi:hypothetical protein